MPVTRPGGQGAPLLHHVHHGIVGHNFGRKIILTLVGVLLAYGIVLFGTMIRNNLRQFEVIGYAPRQERSIRIESEGKVTVKPDIGLTTIGMVAEGKTVAEAQEKNSKVITDLVTKAKALGIAEADIQTANYNIYPKYRYSEKEGQVLDGYQVNQSVAVKIRDLTKANSVIALAGEVGANTVSGLDFTIDDRDAYVDAARRVAMEKLGEKAAMLSETLGVDLVSVVSYDEYEQGQNNPSPFYRASNIAVEMDAAGGMKASTGVETGSTDVILHIAVVFEIR